ncbi:MAG TPA: right-handed parallel beta-helix repeat-containing protein [Pirellulales bacterium]|jgi:hypothetical protein|nr:right-handed parallel beta-helix repeat-containing protein [Pirellulales bacterium]
MTLAIETFSRRTFCLCGAWIAALLLAWSATAGAATWHVDAAKGDDANTGETDSPLRTIMRAAKLVNPGDLVLVHPGVYFEHVKLERSGTSDAPITFRAVGGPEKTVVTGAHQPLREGLLKWQRVDEPLGLWRIGLPDEPATLLCDNLNLYRYPSLAELRALVVNDVSGQKMPGPGPKHGWAWADGHVYLRLHPAGYYGSTDPNAHTLKASPARGAGFRGDEIDSRTRACFSLSTPGATHAVIEGFTCESPGFCGVWVRKGGVVVRNCRFVGCRTGVRGWDRAEKKPRNLSDDVVVEHCEFSEHPTYADVAEIIAETTALPDAERQKLARFFWWHRKGGAYSAEIGLITAAGRRWTVRDNFVHDTFDGLSFMSLSWSEECEVSRNRFQRIVDNAIESENHAQRLRVRDNVIVDCFEPFSYQPLGGEPWPTDIVFERNTVSFTQAGVALWGSDKLGWRPGCCKIYVTPDLTEVPGGLIFRENLMWFPTGRLLSMNQAARALRGVRFHKNVVGARALGGTEDGAAPEHVEFSGNHAAAVSGEGAPSLRAFTADDGVLHGSAAELGISVDGETGAVRVAAGSAASKLGIRQP